jgi:hypothetical protein
MNKYTPFEKSCRPGIFFEPWDRGRSIQNDTACGEVRRSRWSHMDGNGVSVMSVTPSTWSSEMGRCRRSPYRG